MTDLPRSPQRDPSKVTCMVCGSVPRDLVLTEAGWRCFDVYACARAAAPFSRVEPGTSTVDEMMRWPWTIDSEPSGDPDEFTVRVRELPGTIVVGTRDEIDREFWGALRASLEARVDHGDPIPYPSAPAASLSSGTPAGSQAGAQEWESLFNALFVASRDASFDCGRYADNATSEYAARFKVSQRATAAVEEHVAELVAALRSAQERVTELEKLHATIHELAENGQHRPEFTLQHIESLTAAARSVDGGKTA